MVSVVSGAVKVTVISYIRPSSTGGASVSLVTLGTTTAATGQPARGQPSTGGGAEGGAVGGGDEGGAGVGGGESVLVRLTSTVQCGYVAQSSCSAITRLTIAITVYPSSAV